MNFKAYFVCIGPSIVLMILFVFINISYYQIMYGVKTRDFLIRTISLNILAILVGWFPVLYFWPDFSVKYLMPTSCVFGALACVGSRFIYSEIVPEQLAEQIVKLIRDKAGKENDEETD